MYMCIYIHIYIHHIHILASMSYISQNRVGCTELTNKLKISVAHPSKNLFPVPIIYALLVWGSLAQ